MRDIIFCAPVINATGHFQPGSDLKSIFGHVDTGNALEAAWQLTPALGALTPEVLQVFPAEAHVALARPDQYFLAWCNDDHADHVFFT